MRNDSCIKYNLPSTGGLTLQSGVEDLKKAITAFQNLDGGVIDKLLQFDNIKVGNI